MKLTVLICTVRYHHSFSNCSYIILRRTKFYNRKNEHDGMFSNATDVTQANTIKACTQGAGGRR